jgi:hypothetical protein
MEECPGEIGVGPVPARHCVVSQPDRSANLGEAQGRRTRGKTIRVFLTVVRWR